MSQGAFVGRLVNGIASALGDLGTALGDSGRLSALVSDLGAALELGATAAQVQAVLGPLPNDLEQLATAAANLDLAASAAQLAAATANVVEAIAKVVNDAHTLASTTTASGPAPFNDPAFWGRFFDDALALLAYDTVSQQLPGVFALLRIMGIAVVNDPSTGKPLRAIEWQRLPQALGNPLSALTATYGWGAQLAFVPMLNAVADAAQALGLPAAVTDPAGVMASCWDAAALGPNQVVPFIRTSLYRSVIALGTDDPVLATIDVGIEFVPIPDATQQGAPVGMAVALDIQGTASDQLDLAAGVTLQAQAGGDVAVRVELRPTGAHLAAPPSGAVRSTLRIVAQPPQPWILGDPGSTRLELNQVVLTGSADVSTAASPEASVGVAIQGSTVLDLGAADGFLQTIVGTGAMTAAIKGSLTWSSINGLRLLGGASLKGNVPLDMEIGGALRLDNASAEVNPQGNGAQLILGVSGTLSLGVLTASVDTVGMSATVKPVTRGEAPGNLGPLDFEFGFQPPKGLGLALDAGVATGGGFIECDASKGQYAGILELALESLSLTAIGLIQTKMADGSPLPGGFSLLVIISVEFLPPIELGFGFSLNGVGGFLGLNRTMNVDALRAGVRSGSLDNTMFPANPVGHAPQLIQALAGFFPAAPGRFLLGPMVQIQWGSPAPILTADLGVLVELPAPVRVAVLGVLQIGLPQADEDAVVLLNFDVLGMVDLGLGTLSLDASLFKSRIAEFPVSGGMALRLGWKAERQFIAAMGGFNPATQPPPGFPTLNRLAISLSSSDTFSFTLQAYFAITSNTIQFGAKAHLLVHTGQARLDGMMSFDALIHTHPFGLEVDFAAAVTVWIDGSQLLAVTVGGHLTGPSPWQISGQASIHLFFISATISFHFQLGSAPPSPPSAPVRVIDLLATDVQNTINWSTLPPPGDTVVTLTPAPASGTEMRAHPLGSLTVHQRTVPLGISIGKFGAADVAGPAKLALTSIAYGTSTVAPEAVTPVNDAFAPGQFLRLSDSDALSQPAFATYQAGVAFTPADPSFDELAARDVAPVGYTVDFIDSHGQPPPASPPPLEAQAAARLIPTGPAARAPTRTTGPRRYQGTPCGIAVNPRMAAGREAL